MSDKTSKEEITTVLPLSIAISIKRTKKISASIGIFCFFIWIIFALFGDSIVGDLPVPSANFLTYKLFQMVRSSSSDFDPRVQEEIDGWMYYNRHHALGVLVIDTDQVVVYASQKKLIGQKLALKGPDGKRLQIQNWLIDKTGNYRFQKDVMLHAPHEELKDGGGNVIGEAWVFVPRKLYNSLPKFILLLLYYPNMRFLLWIIFYWISIPVWIYLDFSLKHPRESEKAMLWCLIALPTNLIGLVIYLIANRRVERR